MNSVFHVSNTLFAILLNNSILPAKTVTFPQIPNKTFDIRLRGRRFES